MHAEMKKVIFIGGTSFSGSTFLDMILANDPRGFSCGEVRALFHPWRPHHFNPECGCGDENCEVWRQVLQNGEKNLYETIFSLFDVDFILDSSKDLFWIKKQMRYLGKQNVEVKNVLIWKTPLELAYSFKKRGRLKEWKKSWINYHRAYFTLIGPHLAVKYSDLTKDEKALIKICEYLEIPYFAEKIHYWEKTHHTLFGNTSAKIHLYAKDSEKFQRKQIELLSLADKTDSNAQIEYRNVYYETVKERALIEWVERELKSDSYFEKLMVILDSAGTYEKSDLQRKINEIELPMAKIRAKKLISIVAHSPFTRLKLKIIKFLNKTGIGVNTCHFL